MYRNNLFLFSRSIVYILTVSDFSINIHKSPEFTLLRLSRQKGHDSDLPCLQENIDYNQIIDYAKKKNAEGDTY